MRNGLILAALLAAGLCVQWAEKNAGQAFEPPEISASEVPEPTNAAQVLSARIDEHIAALKGFRSELGELRDERDEIVKEIEDLRTKLTKAPAGFEVQCENGQCRLVRTPRADAARLACVPCGTNCGCDPCTCPPATSTSGTAMPGGVAACSSRPAGGPLTRVASRVAAVRPLRRFGGFFGRFFCRR